MARIRSIKPEFWSDLRLSHLSRDARLLYIALWNQADEWGRMHADVRFVKGHCLPYDDDLRLSDVERLLSELERAGRVRRYVVEGQPFLTLPKLGLHQRLEPHKVPSRLPAPPDGNSDPDGTPSDQAVWVSYDIRADESAPRADESEKNCALHVAGSMEHGAGSRGNYVGQNSRSKGRRTSATGDAAFDEFWQAYPRRTAKKQAQRAFQRALRDTPARVLIDAARRFAADPTREPAYTPHPATWLNQGRWDDEGPARPQAVNSAQQREQQHLALVARFAQQQHTQPELGA